MRILTTFTAVGWDQFRDTIVRLGEDAAPIMADLLDDGVIKLREKTVAAEAKQTNLPRDTVTRAQVLEEAVRGRLSASIRVHGGNVRVKCFSPHEGGGGVTAQPWGRSTFYPGGFMTSGRPGARRLSPKLNGQAFIAKDPGGSRRWGRKIAGLRTGLFLPDELLKGATVQAFDTGAPKILDGILTKLAAMI